MKGRKQSQHNPIHELLPHLVLILFNFAQVLSHSLIFPVVVHIILRRRCRRRCRLLLPLRHGLDADCRRVGHQRPARLLRLQQSPCLPQPIPRDVGRLAPVDANQKIT